MKVCLIGSSGTGKSTFIKELMGEEHDYAPTLGVEVHPYRINNHPVNFWDCAGKEELRGLSDGYWINTDMALIFVGPQTEFWFNEFKRVSDAPVIFVTKGTSYKKPGYETINISEGPKKLLVAIAKHLKIEIPKIDP